MELAQEDTNKEPNNQKLNCLHSTSHSEFRSQPRSSTSSRQCRITEQRLECILNPTQDFTLANHVCFTASPGHPRSQSKTAAFSIHLLCTLVSQQKKEVRHETTLDKKVLPGQDPEHTIQSSPKHTESVTHLLFPLGSAS